MPTNYGHVPAILWQRMNNPHDVFVRDKWKVSGVWQNVSTEDEVEPQKYNKHVSALSFCQGLSGGEA
jgi:hypothetical protein